MTECDECGEQHDLTFILDNVHDKRGPVSSIHSKRVVCASCKTKLEDNEDVQW